MAAEFEFISKLSLVNLVRYMIVDVIFSLHQFNFHHLLGYNKIPVAFVSIFSVYGSINRNILQNNSLTDFMELFPDFLNFVAFKFRETARELVASELVFRLKRSGFAST